MKNPKEATPKYLLRSARESHGWTQDELAEKIGTTGVTISRWESGVTFPSRYFRKRLSTLYGKSIQELGLVQDESSNFAQVTNYVLEESELIDTPDVLPLRSAGPVFFYNEPLMEPGELYGRRQERQTLISRTHRKASTSVIGPRRIGKSWLIKYLRLVAPHELGSRYRIRYLDATMPSCRSVDGFVSEALEELGLHNIGPTKGLIALEKGLKTLKNRNITPVLCIDEFEGFGNREVFSLDFFRALRAMTHKCDLVLITISKNPLSMVVGRDVETSGFFNIFEQLTLKPFIQEEAAEFIGAKSSQTGFSELESQALWRYGEMQVQEWPPLRLQLVGKMLAEERNLPRDTEGYWEAFAQRLEEVYQGAVY